VLSVAHMLAVLGCYEFRSRRHFALQSHVDAERTEFDRMLAVFQLL
jgi:hypothetical protein